MDKTKDQEIVNIKTKTGVLVPITYLPVVFFPLNVKTRYYRIRVLRIMFSVFPKRVKLLFQREKYKDVKQF